jgi:undecaprenyl-diphosphatase
MQLYAAKKPGRTMTLAAWQGGGWAELPTRRIDLFGEYEEPFTIQWAGSLDDLRVKLLAEGWTEPPSWTLRSSIEWLSPQASPVSLPVLPRLDGGRSEGLVLIRTGGPVPEHQRLVLRLWRSNVILSGGSAPLPLWIGTVVAERIKPVASFVTITAEQQDIDFPLHVLHKALPSMRIERRPELAKDLYWNGLVLLGEALLSR